jgi:hypothetical protein
MFKIRYALGAASEVSDLLDSIVQQVSSMVLVAFIIEFLLSANR